MGRTRVEPLSRRAVLGLAGGAVGAALAGSLGVAVPEAAAQAVLRTDPLPSWNEGAAKHAILAFVADVLRLGSPNFVPQRDRIAVFDNDGTLWCEMPAPVQAFFASDRIKALAPEHPEWRTTEPFKSQLAGDVKGVMAQGIKGVAEIATKAGGEILSSDSYVKAR